MTTQPFIRRTYEPLKFLGRLFWVPLKVTKEAPLLSYAPTWESNGERWAPTIVFRIPFRFAIGVGVWLDVDPESIVEIRDEQAEYDAYAAVNGKVSFDTWQAARKKIAAQGLDPDEEMEIMQALGIFE